MRFRIPVVLALTAMAAGCLDTAKIDANETEANLVTHPDIQDFDPADGIIPFPNILLLSPTTGLNTLPATCGESAGGAALRTGTLNTLDGVGTWLPAIYATFSAEVDLDSTTDHVFLMKQVADPASAKAVPAMVQRFQTLRYDEALPVCGTANVVEGVVVVPRVPLDDNAVYTVAITQGVKAKGGDASTEAEFQPSTAWFFSRQTTSPVSIFDRDGDGVLTQADVVFNNTPIDPFDPRDENHNGIADTIEQIAGIQQLFTLNQAFLPFVDDALDNVTGQNITRDDILISWAFKTQTVEKPLDPAATAGPATHVGANADTAIGALGPIASGSGPVTATIENALGAGTCTVLPCAAVGAVYAGAFSAQNYQVPGPNTGVLSEPVPGPWASPLNPEEATAPATLNVLAFRPATAQPAGGYPVVIFGHGITRAKTDLFALASQLAAAGMASVAIDWPLHGDPAGPFGGRAVQIYPTGSACQTPGDTGLPDPTVSAACFAPILTANLPGTRDNLRQGAIDILRLIAVLKANCAATSASGGATCNGLVVDSTRIGYLGMSIGSLIGELPLGTTTDIKAAVLNVPATSLLTILENTDTLEIKCPLIDALINNGTLTGKVWQQANGTFNTTDATCVTPDPHQPLSIVSDPGYKQFATAARWVLDPGESVNFLDRIAAKLAGGSMSLLLQEVRDDQVLPNEATSILGQFLGFTAPAEATTPTSATFTPSAGLSAKAAWLIYSPAATAVYAHSSILKPPPSSGVPGSLGTGQMQTDAVTYLATHLQ